jgi:hypothetical protein
MAARYLVRAPLSSANRSQHEASGDDGAPGFSRLILDHDSGAMTVIDNLHRRQIDSSEHAGG